MYIYTVYYYTVYMYMYMHIYHYNIQRTFACIHVQVHESSEGLPPLTNPKAQGYLLRHTVALKCAEGMFTTVQYYVQMCIHVHVHVHPTQVRLSHTHTT